MSGASFKNSRCGNLLDAAISVLSDENNIGSCSSSRSTNKKKQDCDRGNANSVGLARKVEKSISSSFGKASKRTIGMISNQDTKSNIHSSQKSMMGSHSSSSDPLQSFGNMGDKNNYVLKTCKSLAHSDESNVKLYPLNVHEHWINPYQSVVDSLVRGKEQAQLRSSLSQSNEINHATCTNLSQRLSSTEHRLKQALYQRDEYRRYNGGLQWKLRTLMASNNEQENRNKVLEKSINKLRTHLQSSGSRSKRGCLTLSKNEEKWNRRYEELKDYKTRYGDCLVPQRYKENSKLGIWVATQRNAYQGFRLTTERIDKLDVLGFVWDASAKTAS